MSKILFEVNGYKTLYKERGEDSEKIAPSGMSVLSRLDVPVPGVIAVADSGKRIRIIDKKYYLVCQGSLDSDEGSMEDLLFHDSRSNRTFPVKRMRKGVKEARLSYKVISYNKEKDLSYIMHKPHPGNIIKGYVMKQVNTFLKVNGFNTGAHNISEEEFLNMINEK